MSLAESQASRRLVVAAVVTRGDEVLICRRPDHKHHGGLWEFPGGKIHEGETTHDAVRREMAEELAVHASQSGAPLFRAVDASANVEILFIPTSIGGEPEACEHSEIVWCHRSNLLSYQLAPSDRQFAEFLDGTTE